jgi:hypothetical protein
MKSEIQQRLLRRLEDRFESFSTDYRCPRQAR